MDGMTRQCLLSVTISAISTMGPGLSMDGSLGGDWPPVQDLDCFVLRPVYGQIDHVRYYDTL